MSVSVLMIALALHAVPQQSITMNVAMLPCCPLFASVSLFVCLLNGSNQRGKQTGNTATTLHNHFPSSAQQLALTRDTAEHQRNRVSKIMTTAEKVASQPFSKLDKQSLFLLSN